MDDYPRVPSIVHLTDAQLAIEIDRIRASRMTEAEERQRAFKERLVRMDEEKAQLQAERAVLSTRHANRDRFDQEDEIRALMLRITALERAMKLLQEEVNSAA